MSFYSKFFQGDKTIWVIYGLLCLISLVEVYSSSVSLILNEGNHWGLIVKHATFLIIGASVVLLLQTVPYKVFATTAVVLLPVAFFLLLYTLASGEETNDASRWISIMGIKFQPSELAKLCLLIFVSYLLGRMQEDEGVSNKAVGIILGVMLLFLGLIATENLSTAAMLGGICMAMIFIGRIKWTYLMMLAAGFAGIAVVLLALSQMPIVRQAVPRIETWESRITTFGSDSLMSDTTYHVNDKNRQSCYGKMAVSQGIIGKGPGNSEVSRIISQAYNDFIYAIIIEELGLLGGLFVLSLYVWLLIKAGLIASKIAKNHPDKPFPMLLIIGCVLMITSQAIVNMSVAVGLIPVTGQPLPLISKGGTSIIITSIYFGIMLSVSKYAVQRDDQPDLVSDDLKGKILSKTSDMLDQINKVK